MYEKFFYLKENPFNITPDPKFLYMSKKHQEALDLLFFGISQRKGFLMLSGEVGTGKTTICRALLEKLNSKVSSALIINPLLSDVELLKSINEDFGLKVEALTMKEQADALNSFLVGKAKNAENAVVIMDEAQNLSLKTLEMIRLLSNFETEKMKLLQIVLVGQPELREKLKLPELRQLNQRIVVRCHLGSLNFEETKAYIFKRLTIAGGKGSIKFTATALKSIYEASSGIPRLINIVCDRTLTAAFVAGKRVIDEEIGKKAVDELDMDGTLRKDIEIPHKKRVRPAPAGSKQGGQKLGKRYILYPAVSAVIIAVMFAVWWNNRKIAAAPSFAGAPVINPLPEEPVSPSTPPQARDFGEVEGNKTSITQTEKENAGKPSEAAISEGTAILKEMVILVNAVEHTISNGETLEIAKGDKLKIIDAIVEGADSREVSVNLLGFVPNKSVNKGEDRGYLVDTAKDLWVKYSIKRRGAEYPVVVKHGDKKIGWIFIKIIMPDNNKG
ncbi:MAG: AAA family ATPase [Deltaproteobacteria bacterium]